MLSRLSMVSATVRLLVVRTRALLKIAVWSSCVQAVCAELGPDVVDVGQEAALGFSKQVQKRMAIEVDPDQ